MEQIETRTAGIRDVAREAGVSVTTVSHVLNGKGSFPEDTKARVLEAVEKLAYRPHPAARSLAGARTRVIALAFSHREAIPFPLTDIDYFARAIHAATDEVLLKDYSLVVGPPTPQTDVWFRLPLDGVVVFDPVRGDPVPALLRRRSTPMVVVGRDPNGDFDDPCVDNDQAVAMRLALGHLWDVGSRKPALLTFPLMDAFVEDCEASYRRWCAERSVEPIVWIPPPTWERPSTDVIAELIEETTRPDAILALEDTLGVDSAAAASRLGIRVPDDLKVIAFSDRDSFPGVPITAVQLDPATTARTAVDMLIDLIDDGELEDRTVKIPVRLVPRASTVPNA